VSAASLGGVAAAARLLAARFGVDVDQFTGSAPRLLSERPVPVPDSWATALADVTRDQAPDAVGSLYEGGLSADHKRAGGVVYTPRPVADGLMAAAVDRVPAALARTWTIVDPSCGGGAFLLAAARWLARAGVDPGEVVAERVGGVDVDPGAVAVSEAALVLWAALESGHVPDRGVPGLVVGDALLVPELLHRAGRHPDLVIGNPPFLGQLAEATRHDADRRAALKRVWGALVRGYTDSAALFLVAGRRAVAPAGRVVLVQPLSVLGARDAGPARAAAVDGARLHGMWVAPERVFEAAVRTCAPVIALDHDKDGIVRRWSGPDVTPIDPVPADPGSARGEQWAGLVVDVLGVPRVDLRAPAADRPGVVGDLATATAGFRDQYYGLAPFVCEAPGGHDLDVARFAPLITVGMIDPGRHRWAATPFRFAGRRWLRPVVDLAALRAEAPDLARWVDARRQPKILVATQTRVIEAVADRTGVLVPSVPVISVEPFDLADVSRIAAALTAPPASAWAFRETAGTARSADAVKLAARQVLAVPLPTIDASWHAATAALDAHELAAFASAAAEAYGLAPDHPVVGWWLARLPRRAPVPVRD
jgi:hypothetical protein